ncbi:MAG: hypothetical protein LBQ31_09810 [Bacteroidales bacterium]|jgi:hypothetical protein|nr:hypothetical protein [Bacteroidales bacterium]
MNKLIARIDKLPKWYAICVVLVYGFLMAEYSLTVSRIIPAIETLSSIYQTVLNINFGLMIVACLIIWLVSSFLFHLTALLFSGQATFNRLLYTSSFAYLIPIISILASIILIDNIQVPTGDSIVIQQALFNNPMFKLGEQLINWSFISYYLIIVIFIHYIYNIRWIYAVFSVVIPALSIWGITELIKLL